MGKGCASSSAVLKLLRADLRTNPVLRGVGCGPDLSIIGRAVGEGSGARTPEGVNGSDAGACICPTRFRLRYSRIHAALRARSR